MTSQQRARLAKALADGGIRHVTHGSRAEIEGALDDFSRLERLCAGGYLRLYRIRDNRHDIRGERAYEYQAQCAKPACARRRISSALSSGTNWSLCDLHRELQRAIEVCSGPAWLHDRLGRNASVTLDLVLDVSLSLRSVLLADRFAAEGNNSPSGLDPEL